MTIYKCPECGNTEDNGFDARPFYCIRHSCKVKMYKLEKPKTYLIKSVECIEVEDRGGIVPYSNFGSIGDFNPSKPFDPEETFGQHYLPTKEYHRIENNEEHVFKLAIAPEAKEGAEKLFTVVEALENELEHSVTRFDEIYETLTEERKLYKALYDKIKETTFSQRSKYLFTGKL